jgi:hypothetical protein
MMQQKKKKKKKVKPYSPRIIIIDIKLRCRRPPRHSSAALLHPTTLHTAVAKTTK